MSLKDFRYRQGMVLSANADRIALVVRPKKAKLPLEAHHIQHDANGQLWCGPAAISALTGETTSVVRDLVRKYRKDPSSAVVGTHPEEVEYVLRKLGYRMECSYLYGGAALDAKPTFKKWLGDTALERLTNIGYLVAVSNPNGTGAHWGLVLEDQFVCSQTERWVPLDKAPHKRKRVDAVYTIRKFR